MSSFATAKRLKTFLKGSGNVIVRKSRSKTGMTKTAFVNELLNDDEFLKQASGKSDSEIISLLQERGRGKVLVSSPIKPMAKSSMTIKPVKGAPKMPDPKFAKPPTKPTSKGTSRTTSVPKFLDDVNTWLVSKYFSGNWIETDGFLSHRQPPFEFSKDPEERKIQEDIINKTKKEWDTGKYKKLLISGVGKGAEGVGVETAAVLIQIAAIATLTALGMDTLAQKLSGNPKLKEARRQQKLFDNVYNDMNIKNNIKKFADRYQITQTTEQGVEITEGEIRHFNPKADASYIAAIQGAFESTRKQEYQDLLESGMSSEKAWDLAGERSRRDLLERLRDRWQPKPKPKEKTIPSPTIPKTSTTTAPLPPRLPTATITIPEFGSGGITSTGAPNDPPPSPSQTGEDFEKRKPNDKKKTKTGSPEGDPGGSITKTGQDKFKPEPIPKKPKKPKPPLPRGPNGDDTDDDTDDDEEKKQTKAKDKKGGLGNPWLRPMFLVGGQNVLRLNDVETLEEIKNWGMFDFVPSAVNESPDNPLTQFAKRQYNYLMKNPEPLPNVRRYQRKLKNMKRSVAFRPIYQAGLSDTGFRDANYYDNTLNDKDRYFLSDHLDQHDRPHHFPEIRDAFVEKPAFDRSLFALSKKQL
jgi:hypothetical protein